MSCIAQGKTNWKFLAIVIILAAIVVGGIFAYCVQQNSTQPFLQIWKTYKNERLGIEVRYPMGWEILYGTAELGEYVNFDKSFQDDVCGFSVFRYSDPLAAEEKIDSLLARGYSQEDINIGGSPAMRINTHIFIQKNSEFYWINYGSVACSGIYSKMLSTFKFLE